MKFTIYVVISLAYCIVLFEKSRVEVIDGNCSLCKVEDRIGSFSELAVIGLTIQWGMTPIYMCACVCLLFASSDVEIIIDSKEWTSKIYQLFLNLQIG